MAAITRAKTPGGESKGSRQDEVAALRQAIKECYCGLGPACEIWNKMTPDERAACSRDKRAYSQLLWKHGVRQ